MEGLPEGLTREEEERLREFNELFERLDRAWADYFSEGLRAIREWERFRVGLLAEVHRLSGMLEEITREREELEIKLELGLVDAERAKRDMEALEERGKRIERRLNAIREFLNGIDSRASPHKRRLIFELAPGESGVKARLEELKKLKEEGLISDEVFESLRRELEATG